MMVEIRNMEPVQDKQVVMVAASSQGLGFGIAEALAAKGVRLSLASRSKQAIDSAAVCLKDRYQIEGHGYVFDATDPESIERWVSDTLSAFGRIDGLVVNAGGPQIGNFDALDDAAWMAGYQLTLLSAVRMIRSVLPQMRKQKAGSILVVTSSSVKEPIEGLLLSNVFRSGVASLVKSLSRDIARDSIRINNIVPGRIDTERVEAIDNVNAVRRGVSPIEQRAMQEAAIPLGRYGTPEEFGAAAAFLLSDAARYITGATLVVDGGKTVSMW